jgi:hypothetical protein
MTDYRTIFEIGEKYTVFGISSFMACNWESKITVVSFAENGNPIFKERGKRKLKTFLSIEKLAVFKGWDLALKTDSQLYGNSGTIMRGNACFNFVGSKEFVRSFIEKYQLNPEFDKSKVLAVSSTEMNTEEVVFPELAIQGRHVVIDRIMQK